MNIFFELMKKDEKKSRKKKNFFGSKKLQGSYLTLGKVTELMKI